MQRLFLTFIFLLMITPLQMNAQQTSAGQYAAVNGLQLYYEIHGSGRPLVLLHGGGSTIQSTFGRILPQLAASRRVIAVELQAHGRTKDIDRPLSFEQDADDVAALLAQLHIEKADFMGFSNGGTTCLQLGIRHPQLVNRLVLVSATYKRSGLPAGFFEGMQQATLDNMPQPLKEAFRQVNPDPQALLASFNRDKTRMIGFKDISDDDIKGIQAPALVIGGDQDVVLPEHTLALFRTLPHARLAILPGAHGECIGEICAVDRHSKMPAMATDMITMFLDGK